MSNPKVLDPKTVASTNLLPPHVVATFKGTFYRSVGAGKGKEYVPFEKKVKVPFSVISNRGIHPIAFFKRYKKAKLMNDLGGVGLRQCFLTKIEGDLPPLATEQLVNWLADFEQLKDVADKLGERTFMDYDRVKETEERKSVTLRSELYPDSEKLRFAIKLLINDPTAFFYFQKRIEEADALAPKSMEADIAALADDD